MQAPSDAEEEYLLWNTQIRELLVTFILGSILCGIAYSIINYFRRPITPGEEDRNMLSFYLGCVGLAVALGSMLLVPTTIVCHDVLILLPNNYYLQWLSRHLVYTLWTRVFWASNVSIFALLPLAYFYHEASGFGQKFKGVWWRIYEALFVWLLVSAVLGGFVFLLRSLYASSQSTPDYTPFAYSLMSLVGSLFILWYTPGGIAVLGRASIDLFRTYKVLVPANRQELLFETEALKFKLHKLESQQSAREHRSDFDTFGSGQRNRAATSASLNPSASALPTSHSSLPLPSPSNTIWTKSSLMPSVRKDASTPTPDSAPSWFLQPISELERQLIQSNNSPPPTTTTRRPSSVNAENFTNSGSSSELEAADRPPSPYHFARSLSTESTTLRSSSNSINGDSKSEGNSKEDVFQSLLQKRQVITSKDSLETIFPSEGVSSLTWLLQHSNARNRRRILSEDLPQVQDVDWLAAEHEHAVLRGRLERVQQELAKYEQEPARVTLLSSTRWAMRNLVAIILSTVNLVLPLLLFIRAIDVQLRHAITTEGAVYYYSFLRPEEGSSTVWFTSEIALIVYLTLAALTGLYNSGLLRHFKLRKGRTGMHKIIVSVYFCLIVAAALPVAGRILGLISFDLMGAYDNMGYLKSSLLASSMQMLFALLLLKRYLEFFPWTNRVYEAFHHALDWANRPLLTH